MQKKLFLVVPGKDEQKPLHKIFDDMLLAARHDGEVLSFKAVDRYAFIVNARVDHDELSFLIHAEIVLLGEVDTIDGRTLDIARHIAAYIINRGECVV